MNTRTRLVAVALAATVPFSLTACGGSSASDQAKASIKAMLLKDQTTQSSGSNPLKFTDSQAGCVAGTAVDKIGLTELQAIGVVDKSNHAVENSLQAHKLTNADATKLVNAMFDCTGGGAVIVNKLQTAILTQAASAPASAQACIKNKITTDFTKQFMAAALSGSTQTQGVQMLEGALAGCVTGSH